LTAVAWTASLSAIGVGLFDDIGPRSAIGDALVRTGLVGAALTTALAVVLRSSGAAKRYSIAVFGTWPFTVFGLFLVWQIGLSAEQAAACLDGDGEACATLGERKLRRGKVDDGLRWHEEGCARGSGRACAALAYATEDENGAARYFSLACDAGVSQACARLAETTPDPTERLRLLERACDLGDASACDSLRPSQ
jgi:hypothetical protein